MTPAADTKSSRTPVPVEQRLLVSVDDACDIIECCRASLYKLLSAGVIRAKKQGSRTLIPMTELRRYAESLPDMLPS